METKIVKSLVESFFDPKKLNFKNEYEFNIRNKNTYKIGYATNLSVEMISCAISNKVDCIVTHHDAWDFVYGLKQECIKVLEENHISNVFIHLPLDDCDFGNNQTFMEMLEAENIIKTHVQDIIFYCGRIGTLKEETGFESFVNRIESLLGEKVRYWKNHSRQIKKVGLVTGAGHSTDDVKEAADNGCDVYITGEKILYTVQYAAFKKINLIVASHTNIEKFGVRKLCGKVKEEFDDIKIVELSEGYID